MYVFNFVYQRLEDSQTGEDKLAASERRSKTELMKVKGDVAAMKQVKHLLKAINTISIQSYCMQYCPRVVASQMQLSGG